MGKIKDMSIKKAFVAVASIFLIVAILLSVSSFFVLESIKNGIVEKYSHNINGTGLNPNIILIDPSAFSQADQTLLNIIESLKLLFPLLFFVISLVTAASIFYRAKLKKPLALLKAGADKISESDLDFTIAYDCKDEMGDLCSAFEKMRKELKDNYIRMWRMTEERKRLNAVFAHDLRTPITVLKGYTDLLTNYIPTGKIGQKKLLSTTALMSENVLRLEQYVDSVNNLQKLEDMDACPDQVTVSDFMNHLESNMKILSEAQGKSIALQNQISAFVLCFDEKLVFRVLGNIVSNALRYAKESVAVTCNRTQEFLIFETADDGEGFRPEDLRLAAEPFYKDKRATDSRHLGLGLYICKILCQKHGGNLALENTKNSGAKVTATFSLKVDKK